MYAPLIRQSDCEKDQFCNKMASEWDLKNPSEMILGLENFNREETK